MHDVRIIPVLLLKEFGLYKGIKFKNHRYIGDPINALKIFNEKEVDELVFLDIEATLKGREPNYGILSDIASECFMPLCYGGGISSLNQIEKLLYIGVEKVSINSAAHKDKKLISDASDMFGSSTIVASIDVKSTLFGKKVFSDSGTVNTKLNPVDYAIEMESLGAGEILINSIDSDGLMKGYDKDLIKKVSEAVDIPVIACGGAGSIEDMGAVIQETDVSAVAAGSFFVFQGKHRAVLITYPDKGELEKIQRFCK